MFVSPEFFFLNCELIKIDFGRLISTNLFTVSRYKYVKNNGRSIHIKHIHLQKRKVIYIKLQSDKSVQYRDNVFLPFF